ncbi:MAG: rod shape-determining protein MreC [Bacteroidota bacterium]
MKNLLRLIIRFHFFLLFVIFEVFSFILLVNYNSYQRASFVNSSNAAFAVFYSGYDQIVSYFSLSETNRILVEENTKLHNQLKENYKVNKVKTHEVEDSVYSQQYRYFNAKVVNNSVNRQRNYMTLNKGSKHGVKPDMAVVSPQGAVGIIKDVSTNFSVAISILNPDCRMSAKLRKSKFFGSLSWDGYDNRVCILSEIPLHVNVEVGDTVVTSGYSSVYPEGILIGTVSSVQKPAGDSFYRIEVTLSADLYSLDYVYIIENVFKDEQINLEGEEEAND